MPVSEAAGPVPPTGKLRQTVTYLEMASAPPMVSSGAADDICLEPPARLEPETYRALYRAVGERWLWWERLALGDAELAAILTDPRVEVRLLRADGNIAGYSEINRRANDGANAGAVEIAFLGLKPAFTGRGLGRLLLAETLRRVWTGSQPVRRVWLHTCDHDHPGALALYLRAGFRIVRRRTVLIDDPRRAGLLPLSAAPHIPLATVAVN